MPMPGKVEGDKEIPKRGQYEYVAKDGTVNFYDTIEELTAARDEEKENSN